MDGKENSSEAPSGGSKMGVALGAAAVGMAGMALARNAEAAKITDIPEEHIETDVLVIGGGIAGTWAALKAKEKGARVLLVDKGMVGRSGKSPWFGISCYHDPAGEVSEEEWIQSSLKGTEYIGNRDYFQHFLKESKNCWDEMTTWGVGVNKPSKVGHAGLYREQLLKAGVELRERIMITDLIKKDGEVVGAAGFPVDEDKLVVFKAKAVISCGGAGTFKGPGYAVGPLTFDAHMMAYRAGAEISGKEWGDFHTFKVEKPTEMWGMDFGMGLQVATTPSGHPPAIAAIAAHAGKVPSTRAARPEGEGPPGGPPGGDGGGRPDGPPPGGGTRPSFDGAWTMSGTQGMSEHHLDGIVPSDDKFATGLPGFFAAGDAMCTAGSGLLGSGSAVSASHASSCGQIVGDYVKTRTMPNVASADVKEVKARIFAARMTEQGFSPRWVTQIMQNTMIPYYVLNVKSQARMESALTNILFLKEQFCSNLLASNAHELRLAHEINNMMLNAEMKLRASMFRTESRHNHYREDMPARDDKNWFAWVILKQQGDEMKVTKRMIPKEWRPDLSIPYEERYTTRFPGEMEYLKFRQL